MKEGYYITASNEKVILESKKFINVSNRDITELVIPEGCKSVSCSNNQLTSLVIHEGCEKVWCDMNVELSGNLDNCEIKMF